MLPPIKVSLDRLLTAQSRAAGSGNEKAMNDAGRWRMMDEGRWTADVGRYEVDDA